MVVIVSSFFVVNNFLQLLVLSVAQNKVLIDKCVEVMNLYLAFDVSVFENSVQAHRVVRKLSEQHLHILNT